MPLCSAFYVRIYYVHGMYSAMASAASFSNITADYKPMTDIESKICSWSALPFALS